VARADEDAVSFEDLRDQTYIAVSRRAAPAMRSAVDGWCQQQGLTLTPSHSADNIASGIALILTTHGFSLMPDYAGRLIPPAVIVRPLVDEPHPIPLLIAYRPKNPTPARFLVKAITADWRPAPAHSSRRCGTRPCRLAITFWRRKVSWMRLSPAAVSSDPSVNQPYTGINRSARRWRPPASPQPGETQGSTNVTRARN
jgi:hypothetical protein